MFIFAVAPYVGAWIEIAFLLLLALAESITAAVIKKPFIDFSEFLYPQPSLTPEEKEELRERIKKYFPDQKTGP